ncbi:hypothetical protein K402DRAFT_435967 [Aulographum hederae CBS 113979]|uniref:Transmembrane protein n=1 Tax=Aulographum hederae CBS 113979 TaxID=1176131 RepID=A0A6G1GRZ4_9PEZI|nr:hypothetical protein K402DRAFT_435967 [Aulographum hederae CBS 113979]
MAEMLSRYIAIILSGERALPLDYEAQARRDAAAEREYCFVSSILHTLVDYNAFLESVARRVGCEPRLPVVSVLLFNLHMTAVVLLVLEWLSWSRWMIPLWATVQLWVSRVVGFILFENGLILKWWLYPNWAVWCRQRGPGATPKVLDDTLRRVDFWESTAVTKSFILLILWSVPAFYVQRILCAPVFSHT